MIKDIDALCRKVGAWHRSVFGEYKTEDHICAIAMKAKEEARELQANPLDPMEVAGLLICALAAADRIGFAPSLMVAVKLEILKSRTDQLGRDRERGIVQAADMANKLPSMPHDLQ